MINTRGTGRERRGRNYLQVSQSRHSPLLFVFSYLFCERKRRKGKEDDWSPSEYRNWGRLCRGSETVPMSSFLLIGETSLDYSRVSLGTLHSSVTSRHYTQSVWRDGWDDCRGGGREKWRRTAVRVPPSNRQDRTLTWTVPTGAFWVSTPRPQTKGHLQ